MLVPSECSGCGRTFKHLDRYLGKRDKINNNKQYTEAQKSKMISQLIIEFGYNKLNCCSETILGYPDLNRKMT